MANFEEATQSYSQFKELSIEIINSNLPFIVCHENKTLIGFTYLNKFRKKSGYRYAFENSIYVDNNHMNKGIGNKLLKKLIKESLKNENIKTIIAVIGGYKSEASIKIHKNNGFKMVGTLKNIGFKKNQWIDSIYMQKILYEKN